jgi:formylglycine-generating enzyme required for sulfatase activity
MIKRLSIISGALFILILFTYEASSILYYDKSYALVIGINKYRSSKWERLKYAVKDAESFAQFLRSQGFDEVITLYNEEATRSTIIRKMQSYLARKVRKNDRVVIFFAGHGYTETVGGQDFGYIVPHDGTDSSDYISMDVLRIQSRKLGNAKHQLWIMDSCFSGSLGLRTGAVDENIPNYIYEITRRPAREALMAGGKNQQVLDTGPGGHSYFTWYLLRALKQGYADTNGDSYITFPELYSYIISAASNEYQTPSAAQLPGHEMGEFVFRSPVKATQPPGQRADTSPEKEMRGDTEERPVIQDDEDKVSTKTWQDPITGMEFVFVKGGCYQMGCGEWTDDCYSNEKPVHEVCIDDFYMGKYEVTQGQWTKVMGNNPSYFKKGDNYPVESVSWNDVQEFIKELNKKSSHTFRLPTEAEWEYACRSGGKEEKFAGFSNESDLFRYANFCDANCEYDWKTKNQNDGYKNTSPAGNYKPNGLGLYDMTGNVWEWVQDIYNEEAYKSHSLNNPIYEASGGDRGLRGGSCHYTPRLTRCAKRLGYWPDARDYRFGFRLLMN